MAASGHASGDSVVGVTVAFTVLAFLVTVSRLITRIGIVHSAGMDDIVIAIAVALSIALTSCMCMQVKYGMGRHADTLSENDNTYSLIWFWASVWIYYIALCFAKLSILLQYLRIFPDRKFRRWCFTLMAVIVGWTFWAFFSALFACWPINHFWNPSIPGSCLNRLAVWFSNAAVNIITDICTTILPLPVLKSLNLPKRQRVVLMVVFGMGGVVCVISILRLSALYAISITDDVSWENPLAAIWSSTEVNVGILCSCLPTLKGCITRYFPDLFSSTDGGSKHSTPIQFELGGAHRGRNSCHISATRSHIREEKPPGRMSRLAQRLGGTEIKEFDEKNSSHSSSAGRRSPTTAEHGIHVTTVVEQEEEREDERFGSLARQESESIKNLVPMQPYSGT